MNSYTARRGAGRVLVSGNEQGKTMLVSQLLVAADRIGVVGAHLDPQPEQLTNVGKPAESKRGDLGV